MLYQKGNSKKDKKLGKKTWKWAHHKEKKTEKNSTKINKQECEKKKYKENEEQQQRT